jgi:type IV pilus assembly protein PilX
MTTNQPRSGQSGIALVTVMVILLLSIIAVLAAGRTGLLNEALVGSDSDYNRTLAAAEALVRDAEMDIQGRAPGTGFLCQSALPGSQVPTPGFVGCRNTNIATNSWFPVLQEDFENIVQPLLVAQATVPCWQGICAPANLATLANFENLGLMTTMVERGARYGQFTGTNPSVGNPILATSGALPATTPRQGWYWVEIFPYDVSAPVPEALHDFKPSADSKFIYRITAIALGQKTGTRAVVRSFYVRNPNRYSK